MKMNELVKHLENDLELFIADDDQPQTCPVCGSRTDFVELFFSKQLHRCLGCDEVFLTKFD